MTPGAEKNGLRKESRTVQGIFFFLYYGFSSVLKTTCFNIVIYVNIISVV